MTYWIVDIKGSPGKAGENATWEISVVRDDNTHGINSYGWEDGDSKLLVGHSGGPCHSGVHPFVWARLIDTAQELAVHLNNGSISL